MFTVAYYVLRLYKHGLNYTTMYQAVPPSEKVWVEYRVHQLPRSDINMLNYISIVVEWPRMDKGNIYHKLAPHVEEKWRKKGDLYQSIHT